MSKLDNWIVFLLIPLAMVAGCMATFGPAVSFGFVWDDHELLPQIFRTVDQGGLLALIAPYWEDTAGGATLYSRPMTAITFVFGRFLHDGQPWAFHLGNVCFHSAAVLALYYFFRRLGVALFSAALGVLVFAFLPVVVEPVAWISGRTDLLAQLFGVSALLAMSYRGRSRLWSFFSGLLLLAALLSKEVAWAFVPLLVLLVATGEEGVRAVRRVENEATGTSRDKPGIGVFARSLVAEWRELLPMVLAAVAAISFRLVAMALVEPGFAENSLPWWVTPVRVASTAGRSLRILVWPWNPSALPSPRALEPPTSPWLWLGGIGLIVLVGALLHCLRSGRGRLALAFAWVLLGLLPVLQFVPLAAPSPNADRFWYVPLGGVALAIALGLQAARARGKVFSFFWEAATVGVICLSVIFTLIRLPDWATDRSLWEAELSRHGLHHILTARNLGLARENDGDYVAAVQIWEQALAEGLGGGTPTYFRVGADLGELHLVMGAPDRAAVLAQQLLALKPLEKERIRLEELLASSRSPQ